MISLSPHHLLLFMLTSLDCLLQGQLDCPHWASSHLWVLLLHYGFSSSFCIQDRLSCPLVISPPNSQDITVHVSTEVSRNCLLLLYESGNLLAPGCQWTGSELMEKMEQLVASCLSRAFLGEKAFLHLDHSAGFWDIPTDRSLVLVSLCTSSSNYNSAVLFADGCVHKRKCFLYRIWSGTL